MHVPQPPLSSLHPATPASPVARVGLHYGWIVAIISFIAILTSAGIRSAPGVLIHPLEGEFGWTRAAISSAVSLNLLMYGLAAPAAGWLVDRFGTRRVMITSLCTLALGSAGTLIMSQVWHLTLLWGLLVGLGAGGSASVIGATVANHWFVKQRGMVLGFLNAGVSTGQLVFLPVLMAVIVAAGWRWAAMTMVAAALVAALLVFIWMRNDPADVGLLPYGAIIAPSRPSTFASPSTAPTAPAGSAVASESVVLPAPAPTVPMRDVFRSPVFWMLAGSFFLCGATSTGLIATHLVPHAIEQGIPGVTAAATVGIMGFMNFIGVMLSGWLTDRFDARRILSVVFVLRGLSLFALPFLVDSLGLFAFATLYGLDWFATVPPIVAMIGDVFGRRSVGVVYGWVFLTHQVGSSLAAMGGGVLRQWLGNYEAAFLIGGTVALVGAAMAVAIPLRRTAATPTAIGGIG